MINAIHREYSIRILEELKTAVKRWMEGSILSAEDDFIKEKPDPLRSPGITVRRIESYTKAKFKMPIVHKTRAIIIFIILNINSGHITRGAVADGQYGLTQA
jgi:hypothetical protein